MLVRRRLDGFVKANCEVLKSSANGVRGLVSAALSHDWITRGYFRAPGDIFVTTVFAQIR